MRALLNRRVREVQVVRQRRKLVQVMLGQRPHARRRASVVGEVDQRVDVDVLHSAFDRSPPERPVAPGEERRGGRGDALEGHVGDAW